MLHSVRSLTLAALNATSSPVFMRHGCAPRMGNCSYAMYELSGTARREVLREATRILKPDGMFFMMEHLPPARLLIRLLYLIRIYLLGSRGVRSFAGSEENELRRFFSQVETVASVGGKTKAVFGFKPSRDAGNRS